LKTVELNTMETITEPTLTAEDIRRISADAGEPEWLAQWRHDAWLAYDAAPMPDRVVHLWRYTDPERFLPTGVVPVLPGGAGEPETGMPAGLNENPAAIAIVDDGGLHTCHLSDAAREAGLVISDLSAAASSHEEIVRAHLGSVAGPDSGKFEALNGAMFAGDLFVYVPPNVKIEGPIHLFRRGTIDLSAIFPRLLLVMGSGAEAAVIDEYGNAGDPRVIANSVIEGHVGDNAHVTYFNIQRWGPRTRSHARQSFAVQRDASATTVNIGLGGRYSKIDIRNLLQGPNAQSEMVGVTFGSGRQHFDTHTEHVHQVGNCFSDMDFKVVLEDEAHSVYTGQIRIDREAANSEAYQENRNLMLDPTCRAESIPELEILNEEVQCTHGATVGPIDEEQVYYLQTRGLSRNAAEHLIVEGFFSPALDRIEDDAMRDRLWEYVNAKLEVRS
jgi:Fe-S cluster assembly protein SufD